MSTSEEIACAASGAIASLSLEDGNERVELTTPVTPAATNKPKEVNAPHMFLISQTLAKIVAVREENGKKMK